MPPTAPTGTSDSSPAPRSTYYALLADLVTAVGTDRVDLVDLDQASAMLRYRTARDGIVLLERADTHERFWLAAVDFWCEAGPLIRAEHEATLREQRA